MLDKTVPYIGAIMVNDSPTEYPRFELPAGYLITGYQPGFEFAWADLHIEIEQFSTQAEGVKMYRQEFFTHPERLRKNCLFVLDEDANVAAVGALWDGNHFGTVHPRIHWIATHPAHQGKGLIKALLTRLMDLHIEQGGGPLYLVTQTWSYRAINLYMQFGFAPYLGKKPMNWVQDDYDAENRRAWRIIEGKIQEYKEK